MTSPIVAKTVQTRKDLDAFHCWCNASDKLILTADRDHNRERFKLYYTFCNLFPILEQGFDHPLCPTFRVHAQDRLRPRWADEQPRIISQDVFDAIALADLADLF